VDDQRRAIGIKETYLPRRQGCAVGGGVEVAMPGRNDDEVGQIPAVRALGIVETVLMTEGVVVPASRGEGRAARGDSVEVDTVQTGRQALHLRVHVDDAGRIFREAGPANDFAIRIVERRRRVLRAITGGLCRDRGTQQYQHSQQGHDPFHDGLLRGIQV
jgi:hypothetical protein